MAHRRVRAHGLGPDQGARARAALALGLESRANWSHRQRLKPVGPDGDYDPPAGLERQGLGYPDPQQQAFFAPRPLALGSGRCPRGTRTSGRDPNGRPAFPPFRATGITAYLRNGGTLEKAAAMANHASTRTTQLYDRRHDAVTLDEVERIVI